MYDFFGYYNMILISDWIDLYGRKNIVEIFFHYDETCVRFYIAKKKFIVLDIERSNWVVYSLMVPSLFIYGGINPHITAASRTNDIKVIMTEDPTVHQFISAMLTSHDISLTVYIVAAQVALTFKIVSHEFHVFCLNVLN